MFDTVEPINDVPDPGVNDVPDPTATVDAAAVHDACEEVVVPDVTAR